MDSYERAIRDSRLVCRCRSQHCLHIHLQSVCSSPIPLFHVLSQRPSLTTSTTSFLNVGLNSLAYTYIVELFPYTQRSQGLAFKQLIGRLGNFFNAYVNPIALDAIGWKYYIFYCVWLLVQAIIVWAVFPETHDRTLEDLSFLLEGKEVEDRVRVDLADRLGGGADRETTQQVVTKN